MSDKDINHMDFKQLRNEVQKLRDELALFKRKYEDAIYNLDSDNFGRSFTAEQNNMRSQINISAKAIETKVSNEEFQSKMIQTASEIQTKVSSKDFNSLVSQTADAVNMIVSETIDTSKAIEVDSSTEFIYTDKIYVIRKKDDDGKVVSETYYYFNDISNEWKPLKDDEIRSHFVQDENGFKLKGDVLIDGSCILTESLTFNSADKPVQVQYSVDGEDENWHDDFNTGVDMFMRMKVGANWTGAIKINARDGVNGDKGDKGDTGVVDDTHVTSILKKCYNIEHTTADSAQIASPTIYSAELYSPNIYGETLVLETEHGSKANIYNKLTLTPSKMYLTNACGNTDNVRTKFLVDLGTDASNSIVKMRLGTGSYTDIDGVQALNIEKYDDEIRMGTYTYAENNQLKGFAGMIIKPSTGAVTFTGTVQAVAVFG